MSISANRRDRKARVATNQTLFREFNERLNELTGRIGFIVPVAWICECSNEACVEPIEMSVHEYEAVCRGGAWFVAAPEHFRPSLECVIERNSRYWVVEESGNAASRPAPSIVLEKRNGPGWRAGAV